MLAQQRQRATELSEQLEVVWSRQDQSDRSKPRWAVAAPERLRGERPRGLQPATRSRSASPRHRPTHPA